MEGLFKYAIMVVILCERVFGSAYGVSAIPNDTTENCKWIWIDEITVDCGLYALRSVFAPVMSWYTTKALFNMFPVFLQILYQTPIVMYRR